MMNTHNTTRGKSIEEETGPAPGNLPALAQEAASVATGFLELLLLELGLAARSLPALLILLPICLLLAIFTWLSFSAALAWLCASLLHSTGWGLGCFFALQLLALAACALSIQRCARRLTLPHSRSFLRNLTAQLDRRKP